MKCCFSTVAVVEWLGINEISLTISGIAFVFGTYFVSILTVNSHLNAPVTYVYAFFRFHNWIDVLLVNTFRVMRWLSCSIAFKLLIAELCGLLNAISLINIILSVFAVMATSLATTSYHKPSGCGCCFGFIIFHFLVLVMEFYCSRSISLLFVGKNICCIGCCSILHRIYVLCC